MKKDFTVARQFCTMIAEMDNLQRILAMASEQTEMVSNFELNDLVLSESDEQLRLKGRRFSVRSCSSQQRMEVGMCYDNAVTRMNKGFGYVEGYIESKSTGIRIAHAWNVAPQGHHIDFTIEDASNFEYFGVIVPSETVFKVGVMNGGLSYCTLPYLKKYEHVTKGQLKAHMQKLMVERFGFSLIG